LEIVLRAFCHVLIKASQSVRPFDLIGDNGYNSTYHNTPDIVANKFRWCDYATETTIALDNDAQ